MADLPPTATTHEDDQEHSYSYYPRRWPWAVIGAVAVLAGVGGLYWSGILHFRSTHQTKVSAVSDANPMVQACASAESGDRWNPQFEPRSLTLGCYTTGSPQVDGIVWQLWDSPYEGFTHVAVGTGELTVNTCTPNCHIGPPYNNLATQQVQVILSNPIVDRGVRIWGTLSLMTTANNGVLLSGVDSTYSIPADGTKSPAVPAN